MEILILLVVLALYLSAIFIVFLVKSEVKCPLCGEEMMPWGVKNDVCLTEGCPNNPNT